MLRAIVFRGTAALSLAVAVVGAGRAAGQTPRDAMVQPPTFKPPERGSLVGSLAKLSIGAEDVSRGSFALPLPIQVPAERAPLLADILPSYAPENGISEWGIGWAAALSIRRFRLSGDLDYATDGFAGPWGRLVAGNDGFYYPSGLGDGTRVQKLADRWIATSPSGTRTVFAQQVDTPEGVYAWYATRVETVLGATTEIEYATSPGGRPFVTRVRYGGPESPETYQLDLAYQTLPLPLVDYASGHPLLLDRRVTRITASVRRAGNGPLEERWRYDLGYRDAEFGPGFYLDMVMRTYASGETEPPVTYEYDLPEQATPAGTAYRTGEVEDAPGVQDYLDAAGNLDGLHPEWAAVTDADEDGIPDVEHGVSFTLFRQSAAGTFSAEPLPPAPPGADPACRPPASPFNRARTLVRMAGPGTDLRVLVLEESAATTEIRVCDRSGLPRFAATVPGRWQLEANMKIADLNRDDRPDLILVDQGDDGTYRVLENISGQGCPGPACVELGFNPHPVRALAFVNGFPFAPSATWTHDMNGDGNPDLLLRSSDRISIWYGRGRFRFADEEHQRPFLNRLGGELFNLDDWEMSWVDANQDGLTDAVLTIGGESALFVNELTHFQEVAAPVLDGANAFGLGAPVVGDFRGHGDLDLNYLPVGGAAAVALAQPSTGLLVEADDGQGTLVDLAYRRAAARPGLRHRPSLLRALTVTTAGYDPVTYQYAYGEPTVHTVGRFLVGFGSVVVEGLQLRREVDFHHDDDVAGQLETSRSFDARTPGLMALTHAAYAEATHAGVRLRREQTAWRGWCRGSDAAACLAGTAPAALETTETLAYERGLCPTRTRKTDRHGRLEIATTLASPAGLEAALHCVAGGRSWTGTHPADPARDFVLQSRITVNDLGQPTRVEQLAGADVLVLQEIAYHPTTHRLHTITTPGQGVQTFAFDPDSGQLEQITGRDGVIASAQGRDPVTDALTELVGDRGPGGVFRSSFRYDGMERLARRWSSFGGSSALLPLETFTYHLATADLPAFVGVDALVDADEQSHRRTAAWSHPDGETLASARRIPGGWVVDDVTERSRAELRTRRFRRSPLPGAADPALATYAVLRAQTTFLGESLAAGLGHAVATRDVVQQGVERHVAHTLAVDGGLLITTSRENVTFETSVAADAAGRPVTRRDQTGAVTQLEYDAAGRLVGVVLPDGSRQRLGFDGFGRPVRIERAQVGTISYAYQPVTGLLDRKEYRDADGVLDRTVVFEYDAIGRVKVRRHRKPATGAESEIQYRYDGDRGDGTAVAGQRGYTTWIKGPAFSAITVRNPDGTEASAILSLAGWMRIDTTSDYYADGTMRETRRTITRLTDGAVIDDVAVGYRYDAFGRVDRVTVNGAPLGTLHYDAEGRLAEVDIAGGQRISHSYDPVTHRLAGYVREIQGSAGLWQTGTAWNYDARGLVERETMTVGGQIWDRAYGYEARGFLARAQDAEQLSTYTYRPGGPPDQIADVQGSRAVSRGASRTLDVAGVRYTYDAFGRVIRRGDTSVSYGADGQLAQAKIGSRTLAYQYDADGNRLVKYEGGAPVAAFVAGGYLTADRFVAPVHLDGRLVGVLENGVFHLLATDPRGTLLADRDGTPRPPTPYGVRTTRPDLGAALDYVEKGHDVDLTTVRMGVRDYDPLLGQFWTPDPLYLEAMDKCAESPVDCNLVGYARNNPISLVDPMGRDPEKKDAELGGGDVGGAEAPEFAQITALTFEDHHVKGERLSPEKLEGNRILYDPLEPITQGEAGAIMTAMVAAPWLVYVVGWKAIPAILARFEVKKILIAAALGAGAKFLGKGAEALMSGESLTGEDAGEIAIEAVKAGVGEAIEQIGGPGVELRKAVAPELVEALVNTATRDTPGFRLPSGPLRFYREDASGNVAAAAVPEEIVELIKLFR